MVQPPPPFPDESDKLPAPPQTKPPPDSTRAPQETMPGLGGDLGRKKSTPDAG